MVRRQPPIQDFDNVDAALVDHECPWRFLAAMSGMAFDLNEHVQYPW